MTLSMLSRAPAAETTPLDFRELDGPHRLWSDLLVRLAVGLLVAGLALLPAPVTAQEPSAAQTGAAIDGPPSPVPPSVVARDASGRATIRAIPLTAAMTLDGRLDERLYQDTAPVGDFIQQEPQEGAPATERTDVWVAYDKEALYVGARLSESDPSKRVTSDMRRDSNNLYNNDHFAIVLDTFYDRRNGYIFSANSQGGFTDGQIVNENVENDWNTIWNVKTANFDGGWTIEFRIPFRSLRFKPDGGLWGINFRRMARARNEVSHLTPIPSSYGRRGMTRISSAGTLAGIKTPKGGLNLDIKPFALGSTITNHAARPPILNHGNREFGADAKWGVTQSLVADFTYNTDFAQVEDDEQQVNLTRFSLFFPEKRDFFLDGQRLFAFGGAMTRAPGPNSNTNNNITGASNDTPILFFSRQIGLQDGVAVPIIGGGRLLGRAGLFQVGALAMRTDDGPSLTTDFSVLRINRDILRRSRVGALATSRAAGGRGSAANSYTYGADANMVFRDNLEVNAYVAKTDTPGRPGRDTSYKARAEWNADGLGVTAEHLFLDDNFNPEVGFLRRSAFRRSLGILRYSPRPKHWRGVRKLYYEASFDNYTSPAGSLQSREGQGAFKIERNNGDFLQIDASRTSEVLLREFPAAKGVTVPVGGYDFQQFGATYSLGPQRKISGSATVKHGSFYDGTLDELTWKGRVEFSPQFYAEPTISWNRIDTPRGRGNNNLVSNRLTYTLSSRMFVSALVQYQSKVDTVATNARFRWEYQPGSELFVVYSDGRTTLSRGFPEVENRSVVVKLTRLWRR